MKGIVHQRSYESIKHLSPKRRGYEIGKINKRRNEIERTIYLLFQTNLLTLELHNELDKIYRCLVNEYWKIRAIDDGQYFKKDEILCVGGTYLQYTKEFKKRFKTQ